MNGKSESELIVGSALTDGGTRPFSYDLTSDRLRMDAKTVPNPGQPAIDRRLRSLIERKIRDMAPSSVREIRFGEYFCAQCSRWIDVTQSGAWSLSACAQCVLDRGSELHEYYSAAPSRTPPATSPTRARRAIAPAAIPSDQPAANYDDDKLGALIHRARASNGIKVICLLAGLGALGAAVIVWPEFKMRFGGVMGWLLNLRHNPAFAAPGIMLFVAFGCGIWAFWRFVYYLRVRVEVREYGIRVFPGSRQAIWDDIDEFRYAKRRLRGSPARESLQLRPRDQKPINLSHRFSEMDELISIVRGRVEPRLIEQALGAIECEGSASFGSLVTVARDRLLLGASARELPFDQAGRCGVSEGQFFVLDRDGGLVFARASEFIPNATIVGVVVDRARNTPKKGRY